jgi:outer membrane receptor protein involved in Fe transport
MKKILLVCCFLASASAFAQDGGKIAGRINDASTQHGLPGVNVMLKGTRLGGTTDINGQFFILNIPSGAYELTASIVGYQTQTVKNVVVNINRTTTVDFILPETAVDIKQEVVITAERPDVVREKTSTSDIIRSDEVAIVPGIRDLTSVLSLSADVSDGHFRGGRDGEELYTLAGMGIVNPLSNAVAFAPILSAVEEVEVITSGFGAQYGNAQSGVVNISMKEGRSDKWMSRSEVRVRMPGLKHFGPEVYDVKANPYLQMLSSPEGWRGIDSSSTSSSLYYSSISYGFDTRYKDSTQASQIAYALWKQARRFLNSDYSNKVDYSGDVNLGGPLSASTRMFFAAHVDNTWDIIPMTVPDISRQMMGNIVYDIGDGMSVRFSTAYSLKDETTQRGANSPSYSSFVNWLWDHVLGVGNSHTENLQLGARFVNALSKSTFYDIKINRLATHTTTGVEVINPNRYGTDDRAVSIWSNYNTVDGYSLGNEGSDSKNERTQTLTFDGSLTSQVTQSHMILSGAQMNYFTVDVNNRSSLSSAGAERDELYMAHPYELGLYVQDKMEFEGMIANVGLRMDVYNQNTDYFTDPFSPFRVYSADSSTYTYSTALALKEKTPIIGRLQPRIGISFPVSVNTVFHLNYGSFMQRPSFDRTIFSQLSKSSFYSNAYIGNPRLKPQDTKSYDVGITQGLGDGFTLDVSGYYKDVKSLIEMANFIDMNGYKFSTFINRDYADIRGFRVGIAKRRGWLTGSANYNYSVATGKSSTPFNAQLTYNESPADGQLPLVLPNPRDILLDFDRTHNIIVTAAATLPDEFGFPLWDVYPLENVSVAATAFARSGRPYTWDTQGLGLINNMRTPNEYNLDVKITKNIQNFFGTSATFYVEIFNVTNERIYNYNTVFQSTPSSPSSSSYNNQNIATFQTNPSQLHLYTSNAPWIADQTWLLFSNRPREIYLGMILNL